MTRESPTLIVVDAGNTNTVVGVYRGDELLAHYRLSTSPERTDDEYGAALLGLFARSGLDPAEAESVVIASVVPPLNPVFERLSRKYFGREPLFVEPGIACEGRKAAVRARNHSLTAHQICECLDPLGD